MSTLSDRARSYLAMLAPHQLDRRGAQLLREAVDDNDALTLALRKVYESASIHDARRIVVHTLGEQILRTGA